MNKPLISILLPAFKSEALIKNIFLASFWKNTKHHCEVIFYDNGGNNFETLIDEHPNSLNILEYQVIGDGKNIGLNAALNECAHRASGEYFYLCHTDMYLMPGWDTALINEAKKHAPGTYLFCSRSIEKSSHIPTQLLKDFGTCIEDFKEKELYEFFATYNDKNIRTAYRMPFFGHKKLIHKLVEYNSKNFIGSGPFDEKFWSFATDNDFFFNCYDIGVRKFYMLYESVVFHLSGQSNKQQNVDRDDKKPYIKLCEKWKKFNVNMDIDASEQRLIPWNIKIK